MDLKIDREWFERRSELEGDAEIGAGGGGFGLHDDADVRRYLGVETAQDIVDDVSRRFAADLDRIFGADKSAPGGTGPIKGEDA